MLISSDTSRAMHSRKVSAPSRCPPNKPIFPGSVIPGMLSRCWNSRRPSVSIKMADVISRTQKPRLRNDRDNTTETIKIALSQSGRTGLEIFVVHVRTKKERGARPDVLDSSTEQHRWLRRDHEGTDCAKSSRRLTKGHREGLANGQGNSHNRFGGCFVWRHERQRDGARGRHGRLWGRGAGQGSRWR